MTDYTELIRQLKTYEDGYWLYDAAAAAIEALQAAEPTEKQVVDYCHKRCLVVLGADLFHELKASYGKMPKRGEWVEENRRPRSSQFVCSECHRTAYDPQPTRDKAWKKRCRYAYCPNCGAKMEVQDESQNNRANRE